MSMPSTLRPVAAALLLSALASQAYADDQWFLSAKDLKGDSQVDGRKGQVEVSGFHFGVTAESSWTKGGGASVGKPVPSAISWNRAGTQASRRSIQTSGRARPCLVRPLSSWPAASPTVTARSTQGGLQQQSRRCFLHRRWHEPVVGLRRVRRGQDRGVQLRPDRLARLGRKQTLKWDIPAGKADTLTAYKPPSTTGDHSAAGDGVKAYLRVGDSAGPQHRRWLRELDRRRGPELGRDGHDQLAQGRRRQCGQTLARSVGPSHSTARCCTSCPACCGKSVPTLVVEYVRNGEHGPITFMQDVFADVYFTSIDINGTDVSNSVVFSSVTKTMWGTDNDGMRGNVQSSIKWDIPGGKVTTSGNSPVTTSLGYLGAGNLDGSPYALPMGAACPRWACLCPCQNPRPGPDAGRCAVAGAAPPGAGAAEQTLSIGRYAAYRPACAGRFIGPSNAKVRRAFHHGDALV